MYGRSGLDRFKKSESLEPFSVTGNAAPKATTTQQTLNRPLVQYSQSPPSNQRVNNVSQAGGQEAPTSAGQTQQVTQAGGGQSTWQPPDWAIEPRQGVYYLEVLKDGEVLDCINLDRRRHIFGRQYPTCDFVLDHPSVSRQHAAVVPHKNGSVFVIDLGSAHGTFVANERLTKEAPTELEVGQSLRFAASTRMYILKKNVAALFPRPPPPTEINLPSPPDPSDEEAVVAYNTLLNRYGLSKSDLKSVMNKFGSSLTGKDDEPEMDRVAKRIRRLRVTFKDQVGGDLVEVVGTSDGADVETEPGPLGVKEGSLVGKYESLVHTTMIPKGKEHGSGKKESTSLTGVADKLQEVLNKIKSAPKSGASNGLYGELLSGNVGSSWAYSSINSSDDKGNASGGVSSAKASNNNNTYDEDNDDLFGD